MGMVLVYRQKKIQQTSDFNYRQIESIYLLFCFDGLALLTLFLYSLLEDFYNSTNIIYIETY